MLSLRTDKQKEYHVVSGTLALYYELQDRKRRIVSLYVMSITLYILYLYSSKLRRRRPSVYLPEVWNRLSVDLRAIDSVDSFKSKLKTSLFTEAFGES